MAKISEIIDMAKKLGIEIVESNEMSGFLVKNGGKIEKLDGLAVLKNCARYTDEELEIFFGSSMSEGIKVTQPKFVSVSYKKDTQDTDKWKGGRLPNAC